MFMHFGFLWTKILADPPMGGDQDMISSLMTSKPGLFSQHLIDVSVHVVPPCRRESRWVAPGAPWPVETKEEGPPSHVVGPGGGRVEEGGDEK
jgi:hypothetical protein